jgi:hypothetical protein
MMEKIKMNMRGNERGNQNELISKSWLAGKQPKTIVRGGRQPTKQ